MPEDARIATIGSPSRTTSIALEILAGSVQKKLIGELVWFEFEQDGEPHRTLGQITEVVLDNEMLELAPMRSLARQRGHVSPISGMQDTHRGIMSVGATFVGRGGHHEQAVMGTVPPTGTYVGRADDAVLGRLLSRFSGQLFYLGRFYESRTMLPMRFPHFGDPKKGGAGEAYHIGIYGKTGSGKSTLAQEILIAYARHPQMSMLVLDPSGEFTRSAKGETGSATFDLSLEEACGLLGKEIVTHGIGDLVLDRWDIFHELLAESELFQMLLPAKRNREHAMEIVRDEFRSGGRINLRDLHKRGSFDRLVSLLADEGNQGVIYASSTSRESFSRRLDELARAAYERYWKPVAELFNDRGRTTVSKAAHQACDPGSVRPLVVINLAAGSLPEGIFWNDSVQAIVIRRIVEEITRQGEGRYRKGGLLNTLVVLDEAQRLVPREKYEDEKRERLRGALVDAVQTTRKYGLGWMFLSTSLSTLHRDIYHENRISFYGFGLTSAAELSTLREIVPDRESLGLYQSFRDPHSAVDAKSRSYSFMSTGPASPLSFSGSPMFLTAYGPGDFAAENGLAEDGAGARGGAA